MKRARSLAAWLLRRGLPLALAGSLAAALALVSWSDRQARQHRLPAGKQATAAIIFYIPDPQARGLYQELALALYRQGQVARIVCVGGARPERGYYGSVQAGRGLQARGVPPQHLLCGDRASDDSVSNLQAAKAALGAAAFPDAVLVTDRLHGLRLRWLARQRLGVAPQWLAAPDYRSSWNMLVRAYWELAAWAVELLPEPLRRASIDATRS